MDSGSKVRNYYLLRHLSQRHQVTLVSFVRTSQEGPCRQAPTSLRGRARCPCRSRPRTSRSDPELQKPAVHGGRDWSLPWPAWCSVSTRSIPRHRPGVAAHHGALCSGPVQHPPGRRLSRREQRSYQPHGAGAALVVKTAGPYRSATAIELRASDPALHRPSAGCVGAR
jgi:hypothetical protein